MKKLINTYIKENYSLSVKELGIVKAHIIYSKCDTFKDELSLLRADVLEDIEKELLLLNGYSITTKQELMFTISNELNELIEEYANNILENLDSL